MKKAIGLLIAAVLLCGCGAKDTKEAAVEKDSGQKLEQTSIKHASAIKDDTCYKYQRSLLDKHLRDDYDRLYGAMVHSDDKVLLDCSMPYVMRLFDAVTFDHPELFWANYSYDYEESRDKDQVTLYPSYEYSISDQKDLQQQVDAIVNPLLKQARAKKSEYAQVKFLFDWIIDHTEYENVEEDNQNMLSVFLNGKAVCAGYSKSFKYMLDQLKIPNAIILVQVKEDPEEYHVINMVQMDKQWYYIDPTFGDIKVEKSYKDFRYAYFAMTSKEMLNIYTPQQDYKKTSAYKDSYFYRNGSYITQYDEGAIVNIIQSNLSNPNPCLAIKCGNVQTYEKVKQLLKSQHIFDLFAQAGFNPQEFEYYDVKENYCFFLNYW